MKAKVLITALLGCALLLGCAKPLRGRQELPAEADMAHVAETTATAEPSTAPDLAVLPGKQELEGYKVTHPRRAYVGEELFDLIDGGAVQFFAHGFEWAIAGTYEREGGGSVGAEVYRMNSPKGAEAVFGERGSDAAESTDAGEDSRITYNSVEFRRGAFYVLVTGYKAGEPGRRAALDLARAIDSRLAAK